MVGENKRTPPQDASGSEDARVADSPVKKLRGVLEMAQQLGSVDHLMDAVSDTFEHLVEENNAMADELIGVYEQLGVVFDLSNKLAAATSESEILESFRTSLKRSFALRGLCIASRGDDGIWRLDSTDPNVTSWLCEKLEEVGPRGHARVQKPPAGAVAGNVEEVMVAPVHVGDTPVCVVVMYRESGASEFHASEKMLIESLGLFCGDMIRNFRLVHELRGMSVSMVRSLVNAVDQKDAYTCGHSMRVAFYAAELGGLLKLSDFDLQMLEWASLLHDVGKIGIRDGVLKKAGKLTDEEFKHIQEHPVRSHRVVQSIPQLASALDGILYHHERYDGSGYPTGLLGESIPLQARIIQVADVFDALTSTRSYRAAFDWRRALEIMGEESGTTLDPRLTEVFSAHLRARLEAGAGAWEDLVSEANATARLIGEGTSVTTEVS